MSYPAGINRRSRRCRRRSIRRRVRRHRRCRLFVPPSFRDVPCVVGVSSVWGLAVCEQVRAIGSSSVVVPEFQEGGFPSGIGQGVRVKSSNHSGCACGRIPRDPQLKEV